VGLMVMVANRHDEWLARIGLSIERALNRG
jgi:hypothetical protein